MCSMDAVVWDHRGCRNEAEYFFEAFQWDRIVVGHLVNHTLADLNTSTTFHSNSSSSIETQWYTKTPTQSPPPPATATTTKPTKEASSFARSITTLSNNTHTDTANTFTHTNNTSASANVSPAFTFFSSSLGRSPSLSYTLSAFQDVWLQILSGLLK